MMEETKQRPIGTALLVFLVGYQWFYNGANFIAFKVGGNAFHPIMLAALRFGIAALLILPLAFWRWRKHRPNTRELASAGLLGIVMLVGSQTLAIAGTHYLPAGIASVFGSAAPIFLATFSWGFLHQSLTKRELGGVALGFAGLALMAWFSSTGQGFRVIGAVLTLVASALWAAGSLASTRLRLPQDPVLDLAAQLVPAAVLLGVWVGVSGIARRTDFQSVSLRAWGALAFLVVVSTLIGYAAFLTLNSRASPSLANTFNYVAPVIALLLSAWLLKEPLGWRKLTSAGITLSGVALMVSGSERKSD